jgi:hypothetical protein
VVARHAVGVRFMTSRMLTLGALAGSALAAGGCGAARQDAHESARTYALKIVRARFPAKQTIARPTQLELRVRNSGSVTVPEVAVTLDSLNYTEKYAELAADKRPIWAIERGPGPVPHPPVQSQDVSQLGAGQTAYVNTWALGPLAPGKTRTFLWTLAPVRSGQHTVAYTIAAGLGGKARPRLASGAPVQGRFAVDIASAPPAAHVNPSTGLVVPGAYPAAP